MVSISDQRTCQLLGSLMRSGVSESLDSAEVEVDESAAGLTRKVGGCEGGVVLIDPLVSRELVVKLANGGGEVERVVVM